MATLVVSRIIIPMVKEQLETQVKNFIKENIINIFSSGLTNVLIKSSNIDETNIKLLKNINDINCDNIIKGTNNKYEDIKKMSETDKTEELNKKRDHLFYVIVTTLLFKNKSHAIDDGQIVNLFFNYLLETDEKLEFTKLSETLKNILGTDKKIQCNFIDALCYIDAVILKFKEPFQKKFKIEFKSNNPVLLCIIKNRPEFILINEFKNQLEIIINNNDCANINKNIKKIIDNLQENIIKQFNPKTSNIQFFSNKNNTVKNILEQIKFNDHMKSILTNLCEYNKNTDESKKESLKDILNKSIKKFLGEVVDKIMKLTDNIKNKYELLDDDELMYYEKYLKYKSKYLELKKNQI